mgnify:FL=1
MLLEAYVNGRGNTNSHSSQIPNMYTSYNFEFTLASVHTSLKQLWCENEIFLLQNRNTQAIYQF